MSSYLPKQLPFLPGNTYADPTITRYHKTQLLGIKDGTITGKLQTYSLLPCSCFDWNAPFLGGSFWRLYADFVCATSEKTVNLQENVDPELLTSMREGLPGSL